MGCLNRDFEINFIYLVSIKKFVPDQLEMDNSLCNMCREDDKCLATLMAKLRIRRCVVGKFMSTSINRTFFNNRLAVLQSKILVRISKVDLKS